MNTKPTKGITNNLAISSLLCGGLAAIALGLGIAGYWFQSSIRRK